MKLLDRSTSPEGNTVYTGCFVGLVLIFIFGIMLALAIFGLAAVLMAVSFFLEALSAL